VEKFLSLCLSGLVTGAIYSLIAAGLTLSYSATGIFNFSYGAVAFCSAFVYYELHSGLHWPIVPAALVTIGVFAPLLGLFLNAAVFRPLARATESAKVMATVGLLITLPALTKWITDELVNVGKFHIPRGSDVVQVGLPAGIGPVPRKNYHIIGHVTLDSNQVIVFIAAALVAVALWYLMRHTPLGLQMRAVVDRANLAKTRGVDDAVTSRYAWIIGMVLASLAGVVGAPVLGAIDPNVYITVMFVAAAAAVLGRLRSIPLAFAGGLLLGILQNLVFSYAHFAKNINGFNSSVPIVLLLVGLVLIARDRSRRGGSSTDEVPPQDYLAALPPWRRAAPWVVATGFLILYVMVLANSFWVGVIASGLCLSLIFLSFVIVTGQGGMVSLAQATFVTAAGLTTGLLIHRAHMEFFLAALVAVIVTVLLGVVVALPALRLGGLPLALATLALALLGDQVLFQWNWLRNAQDGWSIPRPTIGPFHLSDNRTMAIFLLILVGLVMLMIRNLKHSTWGRSIAAVRSSEIAASTSGVSPLRTKLGLFALSAGVAAIGGIFFVSFQQSVNNVTTPATTGLLWLVTVVLFGIRRPAAAAMAGLVSAISPVILGTGFHWGITWLSWNGTKSPDIPSILFGLGAVQLARDPDGILAQTARQKFERKLKRNARQAALATAGAGAGTSAGVAEQEAAAIAEETQRHEDTLVKMGALHAHADGEGDGAAADAAFQVRGLYVGYGDVEVLHGIDLNILSGKITALFGANGSGKSTLCSTISGLVPVSRGSLTFEGKDVTRMGAHKRAKAGIFVAPESRGIFPGLTVEENLTLRLQKASDRDQVLRSFPQLSQRRNLLAGSLSGGEQQMLTLASALVNPPALVVADEPTLGLAPLVIAEVMALFQQLRDLGTAILLVEEKVRDVLGVADQVAFLELGHIVWSGARSDIDDERLVAAYLGGELGAALDNPT
jgi:ABC-type branched-subunit amino acid transport system ATPase component/branched-subunit amino acid ABC-type transport system permease component